MAKATSPYLSEVRGSVAKKLTFRKLSPYDTQLIQSIPVPSYRRTEKQDAQRNKFSVCKSIWNNMSDSDKEKYRAIAEQLSLTGYQSFMSRCLSELILYDIYIDNTQNPSDLVNFQVPLEITNDQQFFRDCNYNKNAISFMTGDLKDPVPYYIESWNPNTKSARIWLKVPLIKASSTTTLKLLIVPSKQTTESDPESVFDLYDDFEGDSVDTEKWTIVGSPSLSFANGIMTINTNEWGEGLQSTLQHQNAVIEARVKWNSGTFSEFGPATCYSDASHFYGAWASKYNNTFRIHKKTPDISTTISTTSYTPATGRWMTISLIVADASTGHLKAHLEDEAGTVKDLEGTNTELSGGYIGLTTSSRKSESHDVDWFRVRKYADPFPSVTYNKIV